MAGHSDGRRTAAPRQRLDSVPRDTARSTAATASTDVLSSAYRSATASDISLRILATSSRSAALRGDAHTALRDLCDAEVDLLADALERR